MGASIATRGPLYLLFAVPLQRGFVYHALRGGAIRSLLAAKARDYLAPRAPPECPDPDTAPLGRSQLHGDNRRTDGQSACRYHLPGL